MRIGIDCRLAGIQHAGIGRYIQHLVRQLVPAHPQVTWVLFFYDASQAQSVLGDLLLLDQVEVRFTPIKHYSIAEQLLLPWHFTVAKLRLLHIPHFNVPIFYFGTQVITIHDLLWHSYKGAHVTTLTPLIYNLKYRAYKIVAFLATFKARHILVPTNTVAQIVQTTYPSTRDKITVTLEGVALPEITAELPKKEKQLLYVGSLYPHKNLTIVLQALQKLPDYKLIIVSSRSVFTTQTIQEIKQRNLQNRVEIIHSVNDHTLVKLYQESQAVVQPSLSEGFGLTGVEALATGTVVLASDIPTFREVYSTYALFFDPSSVESFILAVQKIATYSQAIKAQAYVTKNYSWKKTAQRTWQVYQTCL